MNPAVPSHMTSGRKTIPRMLPVQMASSPASKHGSKQANRLSRTKAYVIRDEALFFRDEAARIVAVSGAVRHEALFVAQVSD